MLLLFCLSLLSYVAAICYYPDGSTAHQDTPCSTVDSGGISFYCGQGYACLSNAICMSVSTTNDPESSTTYVRGSCTDQKWLSLSCPLFCIDYRCGIKPHSKLLRADSLTRGGSDNVAGGEGMSKCSNTTADSYRCIDSVQGSCNCATESDTIHFAGSPSVITAIGVTASSTRTTATSQTQSPSSSTATTMSSSTTSSLATSSTAGLSTAFNESPTDSPIPGATPSPSSNHNEAIGLGVGIPLGAIILAAFGLFIYRDRRKKSSSQWENQGQGIDPSPPYLDAPNKD